MTREYLLAYLDSVDCIPDGNDDSPVQLYRNAINGRQTLIPKSQYLTLSMYCRVFRELMIEPPKEHGFDSDYAVFSSFIDK